MSSSAAAISQNTGLTLPDHWTCFTSDYASARALFRAVTQAPENASIFSDYAQYRHPEQTGPDGESLSVDVVRIGSSKARRQLVALSGTHGLEGAAGSAVQIAWMRSQAAQTLPDDVSVLMVHGVNPYGYAHNTRTTENNVDLNRNFIDHTQPTPDNPRYADLHDALIPEIWNEASLAKGLDATQAFREAFGDDALFNVMAKGQYTHPEGLMYGGTQREWSNRTLETIVAQHLAHAEQIGFIDWHTGIGEYGEPFFLCFNEEGSALHAEAERWWSADRVVAQRPNGLARPSYQGLVFRGMEQFLGGRPMVGAVIEFGTRGRDTSVANRLDQWLRFRAGPTFDARYAAMLRADVIDAFVPTSSVWRRSVLRHGLEITQQAVNGLARWQ